MSQNIFDNEAFFNGYQALRKQKSYNDLLEQPAMRALLPDVKGKTVLDIGCGCGHNCLQFAKDGASAVIGIDISEKMLAVAKRENSHPRICYRRMDMEDLAALSQTFDLVYSSLAFHYAKNFQTLIQDIYRLLKGGGYLLYSQEHPIITATMDCMGHFLKDDDGHHSAYVFSDYAKSGKRVGTWFVDGVENYHRPMGEIVTTIAHAGFVIQDLVEPLPEPWAVCERPDLQKEWIRPNFLIVKARKTLNTG